MRKRMSILACLLLLVTPFYAARVDTLWVKSTSMNKEVPVMVVVPDCAMTKTPVASPVVYLLHGHGGDARSWLQIKPELPQLADKKGLFFVCPDGRASWYWDSPRNKDYRYETFVSKELVQYVDAHYATLKNRRGRAITGLSMGGHGALWNAIRHQEVFGAAGSTSGGVDIRPFPKSWNMSEQLGDYAGNERVWDEHTVITQLDKLQNGALALIIDCGEDDFFLKVNQQLHQQLLERKIGHDFITRPGVHDAKYWSNSIDFQLLFFEKYFFSK
ncbi:MAG: alpha/beta hydrolase family protein [Bacteroides sp.]